MWIKKYERPIKKLYLNQYGRGGCPLCLNFIDKQGSFREGLIKQCLGCPILQKTKKIGCFATPYRRLKGY